MKTIRKQHIHHYIGLLLIGIIMLSHHSGFSQCTISADAPTNPLIPGMTTNLTVNTGSYPCTPTISDLYWKRNNAIISNSDGKRSIRVTQGGLYEVWESNTRSRVATLRIPDDPDPVPRDYKLGKRTVRGNFSMVLTSTAEHIGSNLCVTTNAEAYIDGISWYLNNTLTSGSLVCRTGTSIGSWKARVKFKYGSKTVYKYTNSITLENVQQGDITIYDGPLIRIPGIDYPTKIRLTNYNTSHPVRWVRADNTVVGSGDILYITDPGRYKAQQNYTDNPNDNLFWHEVASITIPMLSSSMGINGPQTLDPDTATELCATTNGASYLVSKTWLKNDTEYLIPGTPYCAIIEEPGKYQFRATYEYRDEQAAISATPISIHQAEKAPDLKTSDTHYNPVTPPVLEVYHDYVFSDFQWYKDREIMPQENGASLNVPEPGIYMVKATHNSSGKTFFSKEIHIYTGEIPDPILSTIGSDILALENPEVTLRVNPNYPSIIWAKDGQSITDANNQRELTITEPGAYSVTVCATYPDSRLACKESSVKVISGEDVYVNYVKKKTVQVAGIKSPSGIEALPKEEVGIHTTYLDALGRPVQQVAQEMSPQGNDLVTTTLYDAFGRQPKQFLSYQRNSQNGDYHHVFLNEQNNAIQQFYNKDNDAIANSDFPYTITHFEASPLNRVREKGAPGADWQPGTGHTSKITYRTNTAEDNVPLWRFAPRGLVASKAYDPERLLVNEIIDEHGYMTRTFTDKRGQKVMEETEDGDGWIRTHYVFDALGRLTHVIPPKISAALPEEYLKNIEGETLDQECYQYKFDHRGRVIEKKLPGVDKVTIIYDRWDRVVFSQDGNLRQSNQWSFTKYDALDRPILTGLTTILGNRETVQLLVDNFYGNIQTNTQIRHEDLGSSLHAYTNRSYPILEAADIILSATYYDDYKFKNEPSWNGPSNITDIEFELGITTHLENPKGQITGTKIKILDTNEYLFNVNFYDDKYRLIQTASTNHLEGYDRFTTRYDFTGNIIEDLRIHSTANNQLVIHKEYTYDHQGRELRTYHIVNNGERILFSENKYNEIGQLVEKNLHSTDEGQNFLQSIDYRYNIRGWLSSINNAQLNNNPENNDDNNDLFGMELTYNEQNNEIGNTPLFNGNISAVRWKSFEQNEEQVYNYTYDPMNRLKTAYYKNVSNPVKNGLYDVGGQVGIAGDTGISYDKNGNILHLKRKGLINNSVGVMDDLYYQYSGNQLLSVQDSGDHTLGFKVPAQSSGGTLPPNNDGPPIIIPGDTNH